MSPKHTFIVFTILFMAVHAGRLIHADTPILQDRINQSIQIVTDKALNIDEARMAREAIAAMIKAVDPKGAVVSTEELRTMQEIRNGRNYATGLQLCFTGEAATVASILPDSPAADAGVQIDDQIIKVNDQSLDGLSPPEVISLFRSTEPRTLDLALGRGTNNIDTQLNLSIIQLPTIESLEFFPEDIVYIRANGIFDQSGSELLSLLEEQKKNNKFGIILDLRGAVGLSMNAVNTIANALALPETQLYTYSNKSGGPLFETVSDNSPRLGVPIMILIDQKTGGASELLAAVCKTALKGCMVLGDETSGTPLLREAIPLTENESMYFATRKLTTGSARTVFDGQKGLIPDVTVSEDWYDPSYEPDYSETTLEEEIEDRKLRERLRGDGPLSRATDLLLGLKALNISPRENHSKN